MDKKGKITLSVLIISVILISFFSLYFVLAQSDNTKEYDDINKVITIKDSSGEVISDITLNTPLNYMVPRGYQKVAEIEIRNGEYDYPEIINGIELYNIKKDMKEIIRDVDVKYKTIVQVSKYKTICDKGFSANGTAIDINCRQEQMGLKDKVIWGDFTENSLLKGEIITLGIFTEVQKGDHVEWIINVYGNERLTEWAEWTENLSVGLVAYYKLDETSGAVVDSVGNFNGTNYGAARGATGIIDNAFDFEADDKDFVNITHGALMDNLAIWTFSIWLKAESVPQFPGVAGKIDTPGHAGFCFDLADAPDEIQLYVDAMDPTINCPLIIGEWYHALATYNGTAVLFYCNNTLMGSTVMTYVGSVENMYFGVRDYFVGQANRHFDGIIDEVGLWNRSLSDAEISDLWNDSYGITPPYPNNPPSIPTLSSPSNDSGFAMNSTITFIWENSTDADGDTITYELEICNESDMAVANLIYSNASIAEGAVNTSISITLSDYTTTDDDYYWHVRANDSIDVSNWSSTWQFQYANWTITFNLTDSVTERQIDTSNPQVHFDISCDNNFNVTNVNNPYTATDFGSGLVECTFSDLAGYFEETQNITADSNKTVEVPMSETKGLSVEEHIWLEAIYECVINGAGCA